jgi:hypothetical protein
MMIDEAEAFTRAVSPFKARERSKDKALDRPKKDRSESGQRPSGPRAPLLCVDRIAFITSTEE